MVETTHAITVQASASEVWPWLVQMGMDRGGWYSDPEWWDGLAERVLWSFLASEEKTGYSIRAEPSAGRIIEKFQDLKVGDILLDGPPGTAFFTVAALEEKRFPVVATVNDYTWRASVTRMGGEFLLGLNRAVREAAGVAAGDTVRVVACIREPGLERGKRQVAHVLRSLRVP